MYQLVTRKNGSTIRILDGLDLDKAQDRFDAIADLFMNMKPVSIINPVSRLPHLWVDLPDGDHIDVTIRVDMPEWLQRRQQLQETIGLVAVTDLTGQIHQD